MGLGSTFFPTHFPVIFGEKYVLRHFAILPQNFQKCWVKSSPEMGLLNFFSLIDQKSYRF